MGHLGFLNKKPKTLPAFAMAGAGMDRCRKFDFLDPAEAAAAAAAAAPVQGGELVDVGAAARPLRKGPGDPAARLAAAEASLKALQGEGQEKNREKSGESVDF